MGNCVHDHSRWGGGDQLGAGNLLTPETTLRALALVKEGRILEMGQVIETGAPRFAPGQSPYFITGAVRAPANMKRRAEQGATNEVGANLERIEMTVHVGTHIDCLGHFTVGDRMYGGHSAADIIGDMGLEKLGAEQMPPMVTRGVCLDVSGFDGGDFLEAGRPVTTDDVRRAYDNAKLSPEPGDVACLQTGWGRFFMVDNERYLSGEPGLDIGAAEWLCEQDVLAIGVDNMAVEVLPGTEHPRIQMPVHQHCLVNAGVYLVENLVLDHILAAGVAEFCFVLLPIQFKGATGSPVRPIAMI